MNNYILGSHCSLLPMGDETVGLGNELRTKRLGTKRPDTVRSLTLFRLFTFGYLMPSFLQYISFYFNINIATFVGFQIAVYAYVVLRTFTYTNQVDRVNA